MHDPLPLGVRQRVRRVLEEQPGLVLREGAVLQAPRERGAVHQLHDQERGVVHLVEVVDPHDVRVVQRGERAGLAAQPRQLRLPGRRREDLEGHVPPERRVARAEHHAHAAAADPARDLVAPQRELLAGDHPIDEGVGEAGVVADPLQQLGLAGGAGRAQLPAREQPGLGQPARQVRRGGRFVGRGHASPRAAAALGHRTRTPGVAGPAMRGKRRSGRGRPRLT